MRLAVVSATVLAMLGAGAPTYAQPSPTAAPVECVASDLIASPKAISGELRLAPGSSKRLPHTDGYFTDGRAVAVLRVPRRAGGPVSLAVSARSNVGGDGYRAVVKSNDRGKLKLVLLRREDGARDVWGRTRLSQRVQPGDRLRIVLVVKGGKVRARTWRAGTQRPGWQISRTDARPLPGGVPAARGWLSRKADRGVTIRVKRLVSKILDEECTEEVVVEENVVIDDDPEIAPATEGCIGVYNGWDADSADADTLRQFGAYPAVANTYYQPNEEWNETRLGRETDRILRGTSPNLTITSKGTNYIEALGTGSTHPDYPEAHAWLKTYVDGVAQLAAVDPTVPVYATLEHEYKVKVRTGDVSGLSADPAYYGRTLDLFYAMAEAANPAIRTTYWIVGYDRTFEGAVAEEFITLPDAILFDPYANESGETIKSMTDGDLDWIRSQTWYVSQEIGLGEFGMPVKYGDTEMQRFFTDVATQLEAQGIAWGVFFNRQKDLDTRIAERTDGLVFPLADEAFSISLGEAVANC